MAVLIFPTASDSRTRHWRFASAPIAGAQWLSPLRLFVRTCENRQGLTLGCDQEPNAVHECFRGASARNVRRGRSARATMGKNDLSFARFSDAPTANA